MNLNEANLRTGPDNRYPALAWRLVACCFSFHLLKQHRAWLQVRDDPGHMGWVVRGLVWRP
jgi:SH3-like domain-containing protein